MKIPPKMTPAQSTSETDATSFPFEVGTSDVTTLRWTCNEK